MRDRRLVGSDIVIVLAIFMHLYDAAIVALTRSADGSITLFSLLDVFGRPGVLSAVLALSAISAGLGHWMKNLSTGVRLWLLVPQQTLLIIPALGAIYAILQGSYADGVLRSWEFISVDQFITIGAAIIYTAAINARVRT